MSATSRTTSSIQLDLIQVSWFKPSEELFTDDFSHLLYAEPLCFTSFQVNAIVDMEMSEMDDGISLKQLIQSVYDAMESADGCDVIDFNPSGCKWRALLRYEDEGEEDEVLSVLSGPENKIDTHFCMYAACCEKTDYTNPFPKYTIDIALFPPKKDPTTMPMERKIMQKHVGQFFEKVTYLIKKAMIKLELPKFPEGSSGKKFKEVYKVLKEINSGSFAKVFRAAHRETGNVVAVKAIFRAKVSAVEDASIMNEVSILSSLDHPQIIELIDFFEEPEWYVIVMELMEGGDLFDKIGSKSSYNEDDARNVCKKVLKAVNYCHQNGVAHLDLKAKNLLLKSADDDLNVKLGDFGFAERITGPNCLTKQRGTPFYVAPEIIRSCPYDERADMWSLGVIIYLILSGKLPFVAKNAARLFRKVTQGQFEFPDEYWKNVSEEAKEVVRRLLVTDPEERWTASQALNSAWLSVDRNTLVMNDLSTSAERLKALHAKMTFKAAVLAVKWVNRVNPFPSSSSEEMDFSFREDEDEEEPDSSSESEL